MQALSTLSGRTNSLSLPEITSFKQRTREKRRWKISLHSHHRPETMGTAKTVRGVNSALRGDELESTQKGFDLRADFGADERPATMEFLVNVDTGGRKVEPDDIRVNLPELRQRTGMLIAEVIAVLDQPSAGSKDRADFVDQSSRVLGFEIPQGQAREDNSDVAHLMGVLLQQTIQIQGVAGDDVSLGKPFAKAACEFGRFFDGHEAVLNQALFQQRLSDGTGTGTELEDAGVRFVGQPARHGGGEIPGTGHDGSDLPGLVKHFLEEEGGIA